MKLELMPMHLSQANSFVAELHRHNKPMPGAKFAIGASLDGKVVGVAIVGRPVARHLDDGWTLEVNRTCTDGTTNVNSFLYAAAWRAARALGYRKLITYTLQSESGTTMKALGWRVIGEIKGRSWDCKSRPRIDRHTIGDRLLWEAV
jgi:hypothetical protein